MPIDCGSAIRHILCEFLAGASAAAPKSRPQGADRPGNSLILYLRKVSAFQQPARTGAKGHADGRHRPGNPAAGPHIRRGCRRRRMSRHGPPRTRSRRHGRPAVFSGTGVAPRFKPYECSDKRIPYKMDICKAVPSVARYFTGALLSQPAKRQLLTGPLPPESITREGRAIRRVPLCTQVFGGLSPICRRQAKDWPR